ncbi:hypothetical protein B0H10DRAFT_1973470 [Mycena sp. CBHHK59/15]|nr:hypothetical protein B0H10DRAFT_1973470 [Mycena sp. CBHHK59/15]
MTVGLNSSFCDSLMEKEDLREGFNSLKWCSERRLLSISLECMRKARDVLRTIVEASIPRIKMLNDLRSRGKYWCQRRGVIKDQWAEQRNTRHPEEIEKKAGCEDGENTESSMLKGFADDEYEHYGETDDANVCSKPRPKLERERCCITAFEASSSSCADSRRVMSSKAADSAGKHTRLKGLDTAVEVDLFDLHGCPGQALKLRRIFIQHHESML